MIFDLFDLKHQKKIEAHMILAYVNQFHNAEVSFIM